MQIRESTALALEWESKGSPQCDHPSLVAEYFEDTTTGDLACTTCGRTWWSADPDRPQR